MKCIQCGRFMKRVRYQVWVCSCSVMVVDMDGPDDVESIELFVNLLCSSMERDLQADD